MSENVGGSDIFGSGPHVWVWGRAQQVAKTLRTVGTNGEARWPLLNAGRPGRITGVRGPAVLKVAATQNTRALADAAMDTLEDTIEELRKLGTVSEWEDDTGRTGSQLVIVDYRPAGRRHYIRSSDSKWGCWQEYQCAVRELSGDIR